MGYKESQSRIKSAVWQSIAEGDLDLGGVPKASLEPLIDLVSNAAMVELDRQLDESVQATRTTGAPDMPVAALDSDEEVLWQGRPFLSLVTEYVITNQRVRIFEGLIGKSREDIELIRIQDMDQEQTISERILNLGDLHLRTHDPSHPDVTLRNLKDPQTVHEILRRAVLNARKQYGLYYREEM